MMPKMHRGYPNALSLKNKMAINMYDGISTMQLIVDTKIKAHLSNAKAIFTE